MSSTEAISTPRAEPPPADNSDLPTHLGGLRAEIDLIDDALHDLLMRRARVVERVAELGRIGKIPFRPGREAAIIRRLLARHSGRLPQQGIVRLWREMFSANIAIESRFVIAACDVGPDAPIVQLAREHFGPLTDLRIEATPAATLAEVLAGRVTAAALPMPTLEDADTAAWWPTLLDTAMPRLYVVARLPYWASPRPQGATAAQALVVAAAPPDASPADHSLLAITVLAGHDVEALRGAVDAAGFGPAAILAQRRAPDGVGHALIDVAGFVDVADPRLEALAGATVVGCYAVPLARDPG